MAARAACWSVFSPPLRHGSGVLIGSLSGYFGGRTDIVLMRVTEYVLVVPRFFLALLVVAMLGTGIEKIILVIGILGWPEVARVVRAQFLTFREREFVIAARAIGASHAKVIFRGNSPQCDSAGGGGGVDISRARDSLGGGIEFSRFRRSQPDQLGLAVERSSGTDQRIGLAGAVSRAWRFHCSCCASICSAMALTTCSIPSSEKSSRFFLSAA